MEKRLTLKVSNDDPDVGYLYLPSHPGEGVQGAVVEQKSLADLLKGYKGPDVYLDFNDEGVLIGIEVIE